MYVGLSSLGLNTAPFAVSPITSLFQNGEPGAVFIASKPTADWVTNPNLVTMYQDAAGTTPVTALEQPVGLHLDTRPIYKFPGGGTNPAPNTVGQPLRSAELNSNAGGPFTVTTGYTPTNSGTLSVSGGLLIITQNAADFGQCNITIPTVSGTTYELILSSVGGTASGYIINIGGSGAGFVGAGAKRRFFTATASTTQLVFAHQNTNAIGQTLTLGSVNVKAVYGNHRSQSSAGARGTLSARYNKVTARNANPTDLTGVSKSGDAAATLTVVNDAAALAAAGLSGVCTLGNVYKLDNSAGATASWAVLSGAAGNTNSQAASAWVRGTVGPRIEAFNGGSGASANIGAGGYVKLTATFTSVAGTQLAVACAAGQTAFFILPDLREACYAYLPTPQIILGTGATASDYDDSGFPARIKYSGAQGYATGSVDFSGSGQLQTYHGYGKLSEVDGMITELGASVGNAGSFAVESAQTAGNFRFALNGTVLSVKDVTTFTAPVVDVLSCSFDTALSGSSCIQPRVNGVVPTSSAPGGAGTANLTNNPLNYGSRGGTGATLPITGDEFISIVRGGTTPGTGTIYSIEQAVGRYVGLNI